MHSNAAIARALAGAFVAESLDVDGLVARGAQVLGRRWRWLRPLARRVCDTFAGGSPPPRRIAVARFILADEGFVRACRRDAIKLKHRLAAPPKMRPVAAAGSWGVPAICTSGELADWLDVTTSEMDWFADLRGLESKQNRSRLRNYHYRTLAKPFGQIRLIEAPKPRLKALQRRILTGILDHIPPHAAAHGFRRGRSIRTFASAHVGQQVVLRIDLEDFFPSISASRIQALFGTVGYPEVVADLLAGLCTNAAPSDVWELDPTGPLGRQENQTRRLYAQPHLPQGAPTSPALANLCTYRLDCRLSALAASAGAAYSRYADDLVFSGDRDFARVAKRFHLHACAIAIESGFRVHHRKTRIMRQGVRQRVAGIVVNERPNVIRRDYDRLKATLTNCIRLGPRDQNRTDHQDFRAHLLGRISFVEMLNPSRGRRLRKLFGQIKW